MDDLDRQLTEDGQLLGLSWGFKLSFLRYIEGMPDGRASATDGAFWIERSYFLFAPGDGSWFDPASGRGSLAFVGRLAFSGHGGMLSIRVVDPIVEIDVGRARLTVPSLALLADGDERITLVELANVSPRRSGTLLHFGPSAATLTPEAAQAFNGVYRPGEAFEDALITVRTPSTAPPSPVA